MTPGSHTASETPLAGYTASAWGGACAADGTVAIALGESKTCTITNDDIAPQLTLVKTVVNANGGLLAQANFPSFVDGVAQAWDVATEVQANVPHTASETSQPGYTASVWGGDCAANGTITLLPGDNKTCTITNDDIPGGEPRTIGFWENWNTCTGGNQEQIAAANGGPDAGWYLLDDLLKKPGYYHWQFETG